MSLSSITVIVIIVLRPVHLIMYEFTFFYRAEFFSIGPNFFEIPNGQSLTFKFQISTVTNKKKKFFDRFYFRYDIETIPVIWMNFM